MTTPAIPPTAREVRAAAPASAASGAPAGLTVAEVPTPVPGPGQVLVRNQYFHVYAALRTLLAGSVPGAPYPGLNPGDPLFGPAVGEVVAAPPDSPLGPGQLVLHPLGWREYAAVDAAACEPADGLPDPVAYLASGATGYAALTQVAPVRAGDTVFVAGGAGAVGSLTGQIARLLGAGRVIGSTGSAAKADWMTAELGYDAVVVRGAGPQTGPLAEQLAQAAPDGLDVVADLVGGEDLQAAVATARAGARFALIGALSGQLGGGAGVTSAIQLDTFQLIVKRLTLTGYSGGHDPALVREWRERFGGWLRSGQIRFPHRLIPGITAAPQALDDVVAGHHHGAVIIAL
ncbi:MAG: NADP-dependent oxidoreductase [Actinobacteria bacterium]|nr:NADP-dependent oxidoreductase [Actinomycetota bacterium]